MESVADITHQLPAHTVRSACLHPMQVPHTDTTRTGATYGMKEADTRALGGAQSVSILISVRAFSSSANLWQARTHAMHCSQSLIISDKL